ncbi:lipocalin-like domain-containing protein [Roseateles sp. So40a]|uniref:lipocalin-like domain-containing protein n=1 Tax=Roseateles sp. So40a TaxID=3400226 RepID=UPI003A8681ED
MIGRRPLLGALAGMGITRPGSSIAQAAPAARADAPVAATEDALSDAPLRFPRDHGAHPETRVEWWYVTGVLFIGDGSRAPIPAGTRPDFGFQLTFFRVRNDLRRPLSPGGSAFSPAQLMLAHAALSDLGQQRLLHDEQVLRHGFANARAETDDTRVRLTGWRLTRSDGPAGHSRYTLAMPSERGGFALALTLDAPQPPLLQGREGWSRKGPGAQQASRYVSEPQLSGGGQLALREGGTREVRARAWLDHEWSNQYLGRGAEAAPDRAVGWDWLGLNLDDGSSMTLFQMRGADGAVVWTGGSWRAAPDSGGSAARASAPLDFEQQLRFEPLAHWRSPVSLASYPTRWRIHTPRGVFLVEAAYAAQEVDARRSTGFPYWEGVARLTDESGRTLGWGYLEMTGYAGRVPL